MPFRRQSMGEFLRIELPGELLGIVILDSLIKATSHLEGG